MDKWYRVSDVAEIMHCSSDTARARMKQMADVINVGSERRQQLMVPESSLEDWLRNHRISARVEIVMPRYGIRNDGKLARMNRRTGKLEERGA